MPAESPSPQPSPIPARENVTGPTSALDGVRVVEYTEMASASFCARLLANAGADVVKVEPPAGDRYRSHGPFSDGQPDPEWSGMFLYLNAGKRGVCLDMEDPAQKATFLDLAAAADILVIGGQSAELERQGLRREALLAANPAMKPGLNSGLNPGLIVAAITPFGLSGPNSAFVGGELTAVASGGLSFATPGVPDGVSDPENEPPLTANTPLAELMTGVLGAAACVAALLSRQFSGQGCEIDLSLQEGVAAVMPYELAHAAYHEPKKRELLGFALMPNAYLPCKDGYVVLMAVIEGHWRSLMEAAGNPEWGELEVFGNARERGRNWDALEAAAAGMDHVPHRRGDCPPGPRTGRAVLPGLQRRPDDGVSPRCRAGLPPRVHQPRRAPVPTARTSHSHGRHSLADVPASAPPEPAHGGGVARVAGLAREPGAGPASRVPRTARRGGPAMNPLPLRGIRVADFGQVIAAPVTAQILGWLGAEVILVETESRFTTRVWPPFGDGEFGINNSGGFNLVNNNKLSCSLNLNNEGALDVARQLISVSDVLVENYATGVMERLGLGYDAARSLRPDIVYMSLGAFGRSGPFQNLTGFHSVINLFSGLAAVTGYPGTHPRIMGGLIPDAFSGCYCVLAILEALYHRSRTGEGQYIEVSMTEALSGMIPEAVMEYSLTSKEPEKMGNRDGRNAPRGTFRCLGDDNKWVAISVETDEQFRALARSCGRPEVACDPRFATAEARLRNQDELEVVVQRWTAGLDAQEVAAALQAAGVPAAPVFDSAEVLADPHLRERGFVADLEHPVAGSRPVLSLPWAANGSRGATPQTRAQLRPAQPLDATGTARPAAGRLRPAGFVRGDWVSPVPQDSRLRGNDEGNRE